VITLEDVIEEMLQREIIEETDLFSKFLFAKKTTF
jgi:CBS domain containing-hemolysin-like protein